MESSKLSSALLIFSILSIASATAVVNTDCYTCNIPPKSPSIEPPVAVPPMIGVPLLPPVVTVPKLPLPPISVPTLPLVPVVTPVINPPTTPVVNPPTYKKKPCPSPPIQSKCPINVLKLGACVDLLGGGVNVVLGNPAVNKCCPVIKGLASVEAALCLCTTLKIKALNLKLYVPVALQLLISCGKTPPPGFTCSI